MTKTVALEKSLAARFELGSKDGRRHIAFWYDPEGEFESDVEELAAKVGASVIRPNGDEFAIKYRLLTLEPEVNFIVYRNVQRAEGADNWFLDLELAHGLFSADRAALIGENLGLNDLSAQAVVGEHEKFFHAKDRVEKLRRLLDADDDRKTVLAKMCAVLLKTDKHSLGELTRKLLLENAEGGGNGIRELSDYGLVEFFWTGMVDIYGYDGQSKTIEAFVHWLHKASDTHFHSLKHNIEIDFDRWRKDPVSAKGMVVLANRTERELQIPVNSMWSDLELILPKDTFRCYDVALVSALAAAVADGSANASEVDGTVRARQHTFWYQEFEPYYRAIQAASNLLTAIADLDLTVSGFDDGLAKYVSTWSRIDQFYRHFIQARREVDDLKPLEQLSEKVENFYTNKYVEPLATAWQVQIDAVDAWRSESVNSMRNFYDFYVARQVKRDRRVAVIISDALRFEVADELARRLRREDKLDAKLDPILGVLPAYTQMGMAALLPHTKLGFKGDKSLTEVDGLRTDGTTYRGKILEPFGGYAVQAEDMQGMTVHELRDDLKPYKFVYIYHNEIDKRGDTQATERQVFQAAAETIESLVKLIKRLNSAGINCVFVTADHGFLFQDRELDEAGYLTEAPQGDIILDKDRRRVVGKGLKKTGAFRHFTPEQLDLSSDYEVLIPKGTKRLRLQGSGSRYVHGGATLQEIVVPVISVTYAKSGAHEVSHVNLAIQQKTNKITTNSLSVEIAQTEPISDKIQARDVRVAIWHESEALTKIQDLRFDFPSSDQRERIHKVALTLGPDATAYKDQDVELRVEERIPNTDSWRVVTKANYQLKVGYAADF